MQAEIKVSGIVQGVGFRPFVYRIAVNNGLVGYVRNRGDAVVEIVVEGKKTNLERFINDLRIKHPPLARIFNLQIIYNDNSANFKNFEILQSSDGLKLSGSMIPPDVSICKECLRELHDPRNHRHNYFFITCTNCGPRYTIIHELPYDRIKTTMRDFRMCDFCSEEYKDPSNRRFHAQTVACPVCGPHIYLTTKDGMPLRCEDPISETGRLLEEGAIIAVKGNGGFHIATSAINSAPITRLREVKHRSQKPFAIMAADLETVKSFAEVSSEESALLESYIKPIVLLRKKEIFPLSELISPGLHNVGVMLPYTALHTLLFDNINESALVMTSANPPSKPIVTTNDEAIKKLGSIVDFFLLHNRNIAQRCDDSVIRLHAENLSILRRSRGYIPKPLTLDRSVERCILGVGAGFNVTCCLLLRDKAFLSQHIGDVENLETRQFLSKTIGHLRKLLNTRVDVVACDLHPNFAPTSLSRDIEHDLACPVVQIQHHHAHIASLMGEWNVDEIIGIACDGFGYGSDGAAWGGEVLYCNLEGFRRLGHLEEQPIVGGDLATLFPLRMVAGILRGKKEVEEWLLLNSNRFPHGDQEVELIIKQLRKRVPKTTSCGRVLDAISAILGLCYERTYDGEPAMKLESASLKGKDMLDLKPQINGHVIDTTFLVNEIFSQRKSYIPADLAYSAESYLARSLAQLASEEAERLNLSHVGFSGGVAYNEHITRSIRKNVEGKGLKFLVHNRIPPGDGGVSFGQTIAASSPK